VKQIIKRIWNEPAVAIGLIASLILALLQFLGDDTWDANTIIAIAAPFVSALGIRQTVKPALGPAPGAAPDETVPAQPLEAAPDPPATPPEAASEAPGDPNV